MYFSADKRKRLKLAYITSHLSFIFARVRKETYKTYIMLQPAFIGQVVVVERVTYLSVD